MWVCAESIDTVPGHAQINGRSSVLRCSLGTTLARMGDASTAIKGLRAAIQADPANPLARFELAGVLLGKECFQEALQELTRLRVSALEQTMCTPSVIAFSYACCRLLEGLPQPWAA